MNIDSLCRKPTFGFFPQEITNQEGSRSIDTDMEPERYILGKGSSLDSEPLVDLENNCWQLLLDSRIVVDFGRKTKSRSLVGKGIQLAFDLMATLAAAEFSMVIDKGIIFVGYQTALIPIKSWMTVLSFIWLLLMKDKLTFISAYMRSRRG